MQSLVRLLLTTWTYDYIGTQEKREKATELFLLSYLAVSDHCLVLLDRERVIGFIAGHEGSEDTILRREYEEKRKSWSKDKEIRLLLAYNDIIHSVNEGMTEEYQPSGSEITLLIVDPAYRNQSLGSFLLLSLKQRMKGPFYLYSDLDCSYRFYLHCGFQIKAEKEMEYSFFGKKKTFHSLLFQAPDCPKGY